MNLNLSVKDINFIKYLWKYFNIYLITPWYNFDKNAFYSPNMCKIYGTLLILLKLFWLFDVTFLHDKLNKSYRQLLFTQKINYAFSCLNIFVLTILSIANASFVGTDNKWKILLANFRYLDLNLHNNEKTERKIWNNFYSTFLLEQTLFFGCLCYQAHVWSRIMKITFLESLWFSPTVDRCYEFQVVTLIVAFLKCFNNRYKELNHRLLKCLNNNQKVLQEYQNLVCYHRLLGETIDAFNKLFGYQILLLVFHAGLQLVGCLNFPYVFFTSASNTPEKCSVAFSMLFSNFSVLLIFLFALVKMVVLMDSIVQEAERFVDLSYKMHVKWPQCKEIDVIIKLTKFAKQSVRKFSAAGFFQTRKSIIFSVISNVATYFIISIQFNQSQNIV
ncbi:gustatory receptor 114 [Tribolium castaneum]|uniref:Gustatory receptor n=1 Tax=Tribolium castaneum TaxID=7070 RepID=D6WRQ1_TRICA|nr:gustatory receptor 114 [Tribolium castaneum]